MYQAGIFMLAPGSCPRIGTWGSRVKHKIIFSEHGHVAYKIEEGGNENKQIFFYPNLKLQAEWCPN